MEHLTLDLIHYPLLLIEVARVLHLDLSLALSNQISTAQATYEESRVNSRQSPKSPNQVKLP